MKKLTLILTTLIFSLMFSSTSFAEWKKVDKEVRGNTYYVDFERIKKHDGYVYWWDLTDYLTPSPQGNLSAKIYIQGDCKKFRYKWLVTSFHKEPMGEGVSAYGGGEPTEGNRGWQYPLPDTSNETVLKSVCEFARLLIFNDN